MDFAQFQAECAPLFLGREGGIDGWLGGEPPLIVQKHLLNLEAEHLSHVALDQLLAVSSLSGVSQGFFRFYWIEPPGEHPYNADPSEAFDHLWSSSEEIVSVSHFIYGWTRFYVDALLYFGEIQRAYETLSDLSLEQLRAYFTQFKMPTEAMMQRGKGVLVEPIPQDDRWLIAELACKTLEGEEPLAISELMEAYEAGVPWAGSPTFKNLIEKVAASRKGIAADPTRASQGELEYVAADLLEMEIAGSDSIAAAFAPVLERFNRARTTALANTELYLSLAKDLDVYVATSMRTRDHFRAMAHLCDIVFRDPRLSEFQVRYFDPTMSAASGHEDKGLIECLMVKSAKALVYTAGDRDSWGKDSEAAMALSLGKPVVFLCDDSTRKRIFDDIHPLSRLISFDRGVAVGAMVVSSEDEVIEILRRVFSNSMEYVLKKSGDDRHLRLVESVSKSVVRLQSHDRTLRAALRHAYQS